MRISSSTILDKVVPAHLFGQRISAVGAVFQFWTHVAAIFVEGADSFKCLLKILRVCLKLLLVDSIVDLSKFFARIAWSGFRSPCDEHFLGHSVLGIDPRVMIHSVEPYQ